MFTVGRRVFDDIKMQIREYGLHFTSATTTTTTTTVSVFCVYTVFCLRRLGVARGVTHKYTDTHTHTPPI